MKLLSSIVAAAITARASVHAFVVPSLRAFQTHETSLWAENKITTIDDPDAVAAPIAFVSSSKDEKGEDKIMCHVDAIATIDDVDYSVGYPCDHAVDIAYIETDEEDGEEGLMLIETDEPLMDNIFPICKQIIEKEYDAKLALYRTPATLTLAGNLSIDNDDDDEDDDEGKTADLLLTFEYSGKEYNLVRPTDLMLLVGKADESNTDQRILIDDEESESIMPTLMEMLGLTE